MRKQGEGTFYQDGPYFCWRLKLTGRSDIVRKSKSRTILTGKVRKVQREVHDGTVSSVRKSQEPTLGEWLTRWLSVFVEPNKAAKTHRQYSQTVARIAKSRLWSLKLTSVSSTDLQEWFNLRGQSVSARTVNMDRATIRRAFNVAKSQQPPWVQHNPVEGTDAKKEDTKSLRTLTTEQMAQIEAEALRTRKLRFTRKDSKQAKGDVCIQHRYGPMIVVLLTTGLRISEALGLFWSDLSKETLSITRSLEWTGGRGSWNYSDVKSKKARRTIPLSKKTLYALEMQKELQQKDGLAAGDYKPIQLLIFQTETGEPCHERNVQRALDTILTACKLDHFSLHDLRRSFATNLASQNTPPHVLQALLGHEKVETTMKHYVHAFAPNMAEAVALIDAPAKKAKMAR